MSDKKCARCGTAVDADEIKEYRGEELCEDCYMDALSPAVVCDPWAVYTAKSLKDVPGGQDLTPTQQKLYDLVKERGEVPMTEVAAHLGLTEEELRREFAPLRHMEKLRGCKKGDTIYFTLF
jgi:hypothetical protein